MTTWGNSQNGSWKLGVNFVVTAETSSYIDIRAELYIWTKYATWEATNSLRVGSISGSWSYSGSTYGFSVTTNSAWSPNNKALIWDGTKRFNKTYGGFNVTLNASLTGVNYPNPRFSESVSASRWVSGIPLGKPDTPTGLVAERISDGDIVLRWQNVNPSASGKPYQNIIVTAVDEHVNSWFEIGRPGVVTSFRWTGGQADKSYRFAVRPYNAGAVGEANHSSNVVRTTPSFPSRPVVSSRVTGTGTIKTSTVDLSWTYPSGQHLVPNSYRIIWTGEQAGSMTVSGRSASIPNLSPGSYTFSINAVSNGDGNDVIHGPAVQASYTVMGVIGTAPSITVDPPVVTGTITPRTSSVRVSWGAVNGATAYNIMSGSTFLAQATGTSTTVSGLTHGTTYNIQVFPVNEVGVGTGSNIVAIRTAGTPTPPSIKTFAPSPEGIDVAISPGNGNGSPIQYYEYRIFGNAGEVIAWTKVPAMSFTVTGVPSGQVYTLHVRSTNGVGTGSVATQSSDEAGGKVYVQTNTGLKQKFLATASGNALVRVYDGTKWVLTK